MKITREQLKEILREELQILDERTIKTKGGLKVELGGRNGYELLRIYGRTGYVEFYENSGYKEYIEFKQ